jgi:hypothetical protein
MPRRGSMIQKSRKLMVGVNNDRDCILHVKTDTIPSRDSIRDVKLTDTIPSKDSIRDVKLTDTIPSRDSIRFVTLVF